MYHRWNAATYRIKTTALSTGNMVRNTLYDARLLPFGRCYYTCKRVCNEIQIWNSPSTKVEPKNNIIGLERRTIQTINFKSRGFNSTRAVCYTQSIKSKIRHIRHYYRFKIQFVSNAMSFPYKMMQSKDAKFLASIGIFSRKIFEFSNRIINAYMIIELAFHLVSVFTF